jgi:hypothetical protein
MFQFKAPLTYAFLQGRLCSSNTTWMINVISVRKTYFVRCPLHRVNFLSLSLSLFLICSLLVSISIVSCYNTNTHTHTHTNLHTHTHTHTLTQIHTSTHTRTTASEIRSLHSPFHHSWKEKQVKFNHFEKKNVFIKFWTCHKIFSILHETVEKSITAKRCRRIVDGLSVSRQIWKKNGHLLMTSHTRYPQIMWSLETIFFSLSSLPHSLFCFPKYKVFKSLSKVWHHSTSNCNIPNTFQ